MFTHSITTVRLRSVGDYIHPERKWWLAMRNDPYGPVPLTLDDLRARIQLAHANGAKCSICMHQAGFDDASSLAGKLWTPRWLTKSGKDAVLLGRVRDGRQSLFDVHSFSPVLLTLIFSSGREDLFRRPWA